MVLVVYCHHHKLSPNASGDISKKFFSVHTCTFLISPSIEMYEFCSTPMYAGLDSTILGTEIIGDALNKLN